jgi:cystathionine beta-lyase family protein involved in aluminum resistance
MIKVIKDAHSRTICLVDNCYGEMVEIEEPCAAGADLVAGSLIKNPGGTLAPGGGYIVGRKDLIEEISYYLTAPGLGREKGAVLAASFFQRLGYPVDPLPQEVRHDIVQTITLGNEEALVAFCRGLQKASPVEAASIPEPAFLPGYEDPVIMAGGTFVQGASLELSADAPMRPPYTVFLQGGISLPYTKIGLLLAAQEVVHVYRR